MAAMRLAWRREDAHNCMHMIGHHDPGVQFNRVANLPRPQPFLDNDETLFAQMHMPIHDLPKQIITILHTQRHEIPPGLGVIIVSIADRSAGVLVPLSLHRICPHGSRKSADCFSPSTLIVALNRTTFWDSFIPIPFLRQAQLATLAILFRINK
jgi:hypothetical protein